jgi:two-component system cell cycle sensor histidine kinase/response regulator CckA
MEHPASVGILVVDDEPELRGLLVMLLETEGFVVYEAEDGISCLDMLRDHAAQIALVITDLSLPRLGGTDLVARIRAFKPAVRILVMTGFAVDDAREALREAGADEVLLKPFRPDTALEIVHRLTGPA